ncbi:translation initiation factor 2 [Pseudomonas frederiksbergensis]|uniref:translation initiation factor 2 n=1 Tax=Pseudomonas frederiksbergensis TaxID=104087 RepID=UPI003D230E95
MKTIFSAAWLSICLVMTALPEDVMAAAVQEKPAASSTQTTPKKPVAAKKATPAKTPAKKKAAPIKKRPPIASKSKPASEVVKNTKLPPATLDLSLPQHMVEELKPVGTVPLPKHDGVLPQMFGDKTSDFQLNGRLLSNEMQLQLRNEERREVEGAALEFEFKR